MGLTSNRNSWIDFDNNRSIEGLGNSLSTRHSIISVASADSVGRSHEEVFPDTPLLTSSNSEGSIETQRSLDMIKGWLDSIKLGEYYETFASNDITYDILAYLKKEDLKELIPKVGDRLRILKAIRELPYGTWNPNDARSSDSMQQKLSTSSPSSSDPNAPLSVKFITEDHKSMHLSLTHSSAIRQLVCHTAKLPIDSHFRIHDGFDFYDNESSLKDAIFKKDIREFWILRNDPGPAFTGLSQESISSSNMSSSDDNTLTLNRERPINMNGGERPTSVEVARRISDFFPGSKQELLVAGLRNSHIINHRFSTLTGGWRSSVRTSRRFSKLPSLEVADTKDAAILKSKEILKDVHDLKSEDSEPDSEFLEKLDSEEMSPTEWLRGKFIGNGSFGSVYLAFNVFSGDIMAVKQVQLIEKDQRQKKMVDALRQEIRTLRDLEHENIVQYRGFKNEGGYLNIFLEYIPGGSLATKISKNGPLGESPVRNYIKQCLSGLAYLHDRAIIHRDIKGANILVDTNDCVKISDFGLSKHEDTAKQRYSMQGTAFWMAPEVARAREQTTTKADIWSLGCLIIELITGQHPFPHLQAFQALYKIGKGSPPELPANISPELSDLLLQCLKIDPKERSSARTLLGHAFFG